MVPVVERAAATAAENGKSIEIIDPRTLVPLDEELILESVRKTGRCCVVYEAPKTCGYGAEIAAIVAERAIDPSKDRSCASPASTRRSPIRSSTSTCRTSGAS